MPKESRTFDLEERLIDFAVRIIRIVESLPKTKVGNHIAGQLIRCGTSPAPNYGEAQSAESRADFIHKMKICLKELRETRIWLIMIVRANLIKPASKLQPLTDENNELILIFVTSIVTAKNKGKKTS
jgi:four helix bundle protein